MQAIRGALVTFAGDPFVDGVQATRRYDSDAIVAMGGGRVRDVGPASEVLRRLPEGTEVTQYANALITAGFIDCHVHYPQLPIIGAGGKPLLDWLAGCTFAAEERFGDADYARSVARSDLNAFATFFDAMLQPVIEPNAYAPASTDVPHRLFHLGFRFPAGVGGAGGHQQDVLVGLGLLALQLPRRHQHRLDCAHTEVVVGLL